jgi:hypothetical protein
MKKSLILSISMVVILLAGLWIGYKTAPRQSGSVEQSPDFDDIFARTAGYSPEQDRDSINAGLSGQRQNAITRAVAAASPAVVGINVIEVREYRYQNPWSRFFGDD